MANESYVSKGAALKINGEGDADYAWSVEGVINLEGRVSAQIDLGAAPRPAHYAWSVKLQLQATPTQYASVELYKAGAPDGDSTQIDGDVGASDAALGGPDQRFNLQFIGRVVSENAAASEVLVASGVFVHTERYLTLVAYNVTGAAVDATDSNFVFILQPVFWQIQ